ncbi:2-amino-4-hydroxy-6-hydroxymethyldihydropteridine diphosphokinase [Vitreimonas flagellata]|uniref:2-amino-4-hydroxy-6- hydroxymethyldihydropteridine diphosphokinase n=1 Tax=Vitreimonas flagellata TaxID=2560861 RepID=UPI001074CBC7|nr:2-amino-4-hydroxy-6-hydroxymethyldihydropteridine diphosphokinase [Vitreimonas flagellata]
MHSTSAWIAMGTNMPFDGVFGAALLARARDDLMNEGVNVLRCSGVWQSDAWPAGTDQPDYFNALLEADAGDRDPRALYAVLRAIERRFGRQRRERWGVRTLDLDIVAMGDLAGSFDGIELPHPRMAERAFVLAPLAELEPGWRHPELGQTAAALLAALAATGGYRRISDFPPSVG